MMKKVRSGDPLVIPARTYNQFIDAARDFQLRQQNTAAQIPRGTTSSETILIRNDSGSNLGRFNILGIDGILFDPAVNPDRFKNTLVLKGVTPTQANHKGKFVVLAEPVRNGALGRAYITGLCCASINISNASHAFADVANNQSACLTSGTTGSAVILWKESGTGVKWAVIRLGQPSDGEIRFGKPVNAFSSGATIVLSPCSGNGEAVSDAQNITAYVKPDKSAYAMTHSTTIPTSTVCPYFKSGNDCFLLGFPIEVVTDIDVSSTSMTKKTRNIWTLTAGSESAGVTVDTFTTNCPS